MTSPNTLTPRDLIEAALAAWDRQAHTGRIEQVTLTAPKHHTYGNPTPVEWWPGTALAAAGHLTGAWGLATDSEVTIESGTITAAVLRAGNRRCAVGYGAAIGDLCRVPDCTEPPSAGLGSPCLLHLGDSPTEVEAAVTHWRDVHGPDAQVVAEGRHRALVLACERAGLPDEEIPYLYAPPRVPLDDEYYEDGPSA